MLDPKIKSLVARGAGAISLESGPVPPVPDGHLLVEPIAVGLCGTDLEIIEGTIDPLFIRYPVAIGHEWSARIVRDPSGRLQADSIVAVEGIIPCGSCAQCRSGETNLCTTYDEIGFTRDGGASQLVSIPAGQAHPLSKSVDPEVAAMIEPGSVVYRGLSRLDITEGSRALVIGDGTIAMLAAYLLHLWSPAKISMLGLRPPQQDLALKAGVTEFFTDESSLGTEFDICIEASGSPAAPLMGLEHLRRGGRLLLLGLPPHGQTTPIAIDALVNDDITMTGSFSYTSAAWNKTVELANSGVFNPGFLVTHRFALEDWQGAIDALRGAQGARGKVLLIMSDPRR